MNGLLGPRQLALDLGVPTASGREDFLVGPPNEAAVEAIDRWPNWTAPALVLVGPPGSGKSHLAQVFRRRSSAGMISVDRLSLERVPELLADSALIIEDAPGEALDERALFHLLNLAKELRASVLLTSRTPPTQWPVELVDLASRLRALPRVVLSAPDDALLRGVLVKLFADRQIAADESVVGYMLARMERSFDAANRLVAAIDARALAEKADVTRPFVARVMSALASPDLFESE